MITAKILDFKVGERNLIWINVEYDIDGTKVLNPYPINFNTLLGKTQQEVEDHITANIQYQMGNYIEAEFMKKINDGLIKDTLGFMVDKTFSRSTAEVNTEKGVITIQTDGTYIAKV